MQATALCDDAKQDGCDGEDEINCRKSPYFITCIVLYFPSPRAKKLKVNQKLVVTTTYNIIKKCVSREL